MFPRCPRRPQLLMRLGISLVPALAALALPLPLLSQTSQPMATSASMKGAEVYCFMRKSGNNHEVSWTAAYALIKRQSDSLFKTSPEHAAVMITEAVVKDPSNYPDCGQYLGALFGSEKATSEASRTPPSSSGPVPLPTSNTNRSGRYNY